MTERLVLTAMGKQSLADKLYDRVLGALMNMPLECSDERRAVNVVSAIVAAGEYSDHADHGAWADKASHQ
jgi:hypothetical protein